MARRHDGLAVGRLIATGVDRLVLEDVDVFPGDPGQLLPASLP